MKGSWEMWTKFRINHPGKVKPWKCYSGKESEESHLGNHKEREMFVTNLGTNTMISKAATWVFLCEEQKSESYGDVGTGVAERK